eukprot:g4179.t1
MTMIIPVQQMSGHLTMVDTHPFTTIGELKRQLKRICKDEESFQTFTVQPFGLTFQEGAGLFVKATLGDLLGYYAGYDDPISSYMLPRRWWV